MKFLFVAANIPRSSTAGDKRQTKKNGGGFELEGGRRGKKEEQAALAVLNQGTMHVYD